MALPLGGCRSSRFIRQGFLRRRRFETSPNTEDDPIMTIDPECEAQILRYFHDARDGADAATRKIIPTQKNRYRPADGINSAILRIEQSL